jgi:hypothetical protein
MVCMTLKPESSRPDEQDEQDAFVYSLVGLDEKVAVGRVNARGYKAEVVGDWVHATLSPSRIRLRVSEGGRVTEAWFE